MITIRPATVTDVDAIVDIAQRTWWPTYSSILSAEQITYMLDTIYQPEKITEQITNGSQQYLVAETPEKLPVAFAAYALRETEPNIFKLHKLYCLPEWQGHGLGGQLITIVTQQVTQTGCHLLDLNVNRYNKAVSFYQKNGFEIIYQEDIAIGPYWMNDYVMRKTF